MLNFIDRFLNQITMYRLVLYYLTGLLIVALIFGMFGMLPFGALQLVYSTLLITAVCWVTNKLFSVFLKAPTNIESVYITAFILVFIISPPHFFADTRFVSLAVWASVWSMVSKYIFAAYKKHIFNPAAFGVAVTALALGQSATWWVGTAVMAPFVLIGGLLVVKKIIRQDMVITFFVVALLTIIASGVIMHGTDPVITLKKSFLDSPLMFFAFVMFTEPLTTPPTKGLQMAYGAIVGFLFAPFIHVGSIYSTPELALLVGNIFSYIVSPKKKMLLKLKEKVEVARDTLNFVFECTDRMRFQPGQYMEWTLDHAHPDNRGERRYFTLASSPTEQEIIMGVKFYQDSSTFKKSLADMNPGDRLMAGQLAGDFTLPKEQNRKLIFIAGGIGITPFRSMVKYLLDKNETRDIVLLYSNRKAEDIAYKEIFDAAKKVGVRTIYNLSEPETPEGWTGRKGYIDAKVIQEEIPDYRERTFYISGPHSMVHAFEKALKEMGVPNAQIKIDFFPGFV